MAKSKTPKPRRSSKGKTDSAKVATRGVAKGLSKSSKGNVDQTMAEENRTRAIELHKRSYSYRKIGKALGVSHTTVGNYIDEYRNELRSGGLLICADIMIDDADRIQSNVNMLERLHDQVKEYRCKGCKKPVACKCGSTVQVPVLKPEGIIRNRGEIRAQGESLRRLVGADAAKHVVVQQENLDWIKKFFELIDEHHPEILQASEEVLAKMYPETISGN